MKIAIIAALDAKRGIGKGNNLLFKIPADFARMKSLTTGHSIIMGRKTFESIGRTLPNRTNIIISRDSSLYNRLVHYAPKPIVCVSLENAIEEAKKAVGSEEIFIFGGGQVFKEALEKKLVDKLYLTLVEGDYGADTFFPDYSGFKIIKEEKGESRLTVSGQAGEYKYKFLDLEKVE